MTPNTPVSAAPAMQRALQRAITRRRVGGALMTLGAIGLAAGAVIDASGGILVRLLPEALAVFHAQKLLYMIGPVVFGAGTLLRRSASRRMARLRTAT